MYSATQEELSQIKDALGISNPKFITISDKLANEILQCSFIAFNHFQNTETEIGETVLELINKAKSIAIGIIIKERIKKNLPNIEDYIKRKPERERTFQVGDYINSINLILKEFKNVSSYINNFSKDQNYKVDNINLGLFIKNGHFTFTEEYINKVDVLLSLLVKINLKIGKKDDFYLKLCSYISDIVASNIVTILNFSSDEIFEALSIIDKLDLLPGNWRGLSRRNSSTQKSYYLEVRESIIQMAMNRGIFHSPPSFNVLMELSRQKEYLEQVKNRVFFKSEIEQANSKLKKIKGWFFFRSQIKKEHQIKEQEEKIKNLLIESEKEKQIAIKRQEEIIKEIEIKELKIENESKLY